MESAHRLLQSKEKDAFDLTLEPKESYEAYDTGRFEGLPLGPPTGRGRSPLYRGDHRVRPLLHWDTHKSGHTTVARMKKEIDRPIAQLIRDLDKTGKLDRTLVIVASEFSRDANQETPDRTP